MMKHDPSVVDEELNARKLAALHDPVHVLRTVCQPLGRLGCVRGLAKVGLVLNDAAICSDSSYLK